MCFSRFLNRANGIKSLKALHMKEKLEDPFVLKLSWRIFGFLMISGGIEVD